MRHDFRRLIPCAIAFAVTLAIPGARAGEGGLALGPALILVREVPLGRPFTLHEAAQVRYQLTNNSDQAGDFEVVCSLPMDAGMRSHEVGYEAPPNVAWFTLDKKVITLAAHAQEEFDLQINIPDLPEHFNRHWMIYVDAGRAQTAGIGATLRLRARVMLETEVKDGVGAALARAGALGIDPGTVSMRVVGDKWEGQARLRNNSIQPAVYDLLRLDQAIPSEQADKRARYFDHAEMATRNACGRPVEATVTLAPGEEHVVHFTAPPDATQQVPKVGDRPIEEVVFIARRAPTGADPLRCREFMGRLYDDAGLVRLRFSTLTAGAASAP